MAQTRGTAAFLADNTEYREVYVLLEGALKEQEAIWRKYTNVENSERKTEITQSWVELGDVPEKAEGATYQTDLIRPGFTKTVTHTEFGLGFEMTETAGEDDRFNVLKRNSKWLAYSARYVEEGYRQPFLYDDVRFRLEYFPTGPGPGVSVTRALVLNSWCWLGASA